MSLYHWVSMAVTLTDFRPKIIVLTFELIRLLLIDAITLDFGDLLPENNRIDV